MATKKKNPFEEKPYNQPEQQDTRQSKADVPAPTPTPIPPSKYVPQQYNQTTGKVEDINRTGTKMSRASFDKQTFDVPLTSGKEVINKVQQQQLQQNPAIQNLNQLDTNPTALDPLSQDILTNISGLQDFNQGLTYTGTPKENLVRNSQFLASKLTSPGIKILNKISGGARIGDMVASELTNNKEAQRIMSGYSTGGNIKEIRENITISEELQALALQQAKTNPVQAALNYEEAQSKKYKSLAQMKFISKNDPSVFVELRADIAKLEMYFDGKKGIKAMDDEAMRMALNME